MPAILILSSHVAASPVGGSAQVAALARMGIEAALVPTVLFGRHPGLGAPGGGAVSDSIFEGMLEGVAATGLFSRLDAVITGYFASPGQVAAAARAIEAARAASPGVRVVVDPIMGDYPKGLYVREDVALAIAADLIPRADLVAPNAWELARLGGRAKLGRPVIASSIDVEGGIGVLYANDREAWLAVHGRLGEAPNGAGDLLTARFTGALTLGLAPREALMNAVEAVAASIGVPGPVRLEAPP
jgi:pyridoxine kinase